VLLKDNIWTHKNEQFKEVAKAAMKLLPGKLLIRGEYQFEAGEMKVFKPTYLKASDPRLLFDPEGLLNVNEQLIHICFDNAKRFFDVGAIDGQELVGYDNDNRPNWERGTAGFQKAVADCRRWIQKSLEAVEHNNNLVMPGIYYSRHNSHFKGVFQSTFPLYCGGDRPLLALCLVKDETEQSTNTNYKAKTVLFNEWAFMGVRLVGKPKSDWITKSLEKRHEVRLNHDHQQEPNPQEFDGVATANSASSSAPAPF